MTDINDVRSTRNQAGISRRTVMKGAAWSAPLLVAAVAAPAYAASQCTPEASFDNLKPGTSPSSITFQPSNVTATLSYASNGQGGDPTPGDTGKVARTSTTPAWNYLELQMVSSLNQGDYVDLTIDFSVPVQGLSFIIHDIDKSGSDWNVAWVDNVVVMTGGYTSVLGSNIQGDGTTGNPFNPIQWGDTPIDSGNGRVRVTWAGSVNQVKIRYLAGQSGNSQSQHIGIGNLSYDACITKAAPRSLMAKSQSEDGSQNEDARLRIPNDTADFTPDDVAADIDS